VAPSVLRTLEATALPQSVSVEADLAEAALAEAALASIVDSDLGLASTVDSVVDLASVDLVVDGKVDAGCVRKSNPDPIRCCGKWTGVRASDPPGGRAHCATITTATWLYLNE
jgi:hypothetical protein